VRCRLREVDLRGKEWLMDSRAGHKFWESEKPPGRVGGDDDGGGREGGKGEDAFRIWPNC
jgi:hypothetical protein